MKKQDKIKLFQTEFHKWFDKFHLAGWELHFWQNKTDDDYKAKLQRNLNGRIAEVIISTCWLSQATKQDIEETAKHESIHLLLSRVMMKGFDRFGREKDLLEAEEELVMKLTDLLK